MEPFRVDFSMNRGHEMLLTREPQLTREELDEVDLLMLQAQRVPRLLAVDWLEVDGGITFRYDITGRKMVSRSLQAQTITMADFYALLLGITEALEECRHYLLREECCLLHENFIFVGEDWEDIRLAYVPLAADAVSAGSAREALLGLAVRWVARVSPVDGAGIQAVLQMLAEPGLPTGAIRARLLERIGRPLAADDLEGRAEAVAGTRLAEPLQAEARREGAEERARAVRRDRSGGAGERPRAVRRDEEGGAPERLHAVRRDRQGEEAAVPPDRHERAGLAAAEELPDRLEPQPGFAAEPFEEWQADRPRVPDNTAVKWGSGAAAAIALACCWRFGYAAAPGMNSLLVSCGLSLLVAGGYLFALRKLRSVRENDWDDASEDGSDSIDFASRWLSQPAVLPAAPARKDWSETAHSEPNEWSVRSDFLQAAGKENLPPGRLVGAYGYGSDFGEDDGGSPAAQPIAGVAPRPNDRSRANTALLQVSNTGAGETVLLQEGGEAARERRSGWRVARRFAGEERYFQLQAGETVVGRSGEAAQIVDDAEGVSRTHIAYVLSEGVLRVRDLSSRNGSLLNGEPMVPYKSYELKAGDWVQLAGPSGPRYLLEADAAAYVS